MNLDIFNFLNGFVGKNPIFDSVAIFLSDNLGFLLILVMILILAFVKNRKEYLKQIFLILITGAVAWVIASIIKYLMPMPRPFEILNEAKNLFPNSDVGDSFPSGHSTFYSAMALSLVFYRPRFGWYFVIGALLVCIFRIISGVHWPVDVFAGICLGILVSYICYFFVKKYKILGQ